jgi:ankyrin repeat protein
MARGKKGTAKKGRVAKKREKEEEERENEEEEEGKKQKVAEEEKQQETLNKEFLHACEYKTVVHVKAVLERGADLFHCDEEESNALHFACQNEDYAAGEEIVKYLIKKHKFLLRGIDDEHWTALHYAARYSSAKICEILIDNGCDVNGLTKCLDTPLTNCCGDRIDEEALKVAKLLIERGADLARKTENGFTTLHLACYMGSDDVVQLLIDAKADVNSQDENGYTPLICSVQNRNFGEKIIPILMQAGADVSMKTISGVTAVSIAYMSGGGKMLKALAPFVPEGCVELENNFPVSDCPDPIGAMTEGLQFGGNPEAGDFVLLAEGDDDPARCWAMLRNGEFDICKIFQTLSDSDNLDLWFYSVTELWQRGLALDVSTGETILNLAVRCKKLSPEDKIKVVQHVMSFYINPLVLDNDNKRAIAYCTKEEKELGHLLAHYQQWKPDKKVMDWYGPYCRRRLLAFLLVEKRLKLGFPRDLKNLILLYVAEREYVWVPKRKE